MAKRRGANAPSDRALLRNAIDSLVANIRFAGRDEFVDTITITSSIPNEGKSTLAVNLATRLASDDDRVLLVDTDVHNRTLASMLGVRSRTGLYSVLLERVELSKAIIPTKVANLEFLDTEPGMPNPANVFASVQFRNLVKRLRSEYGYVIFDTPPLSAYVDGAVIGSATDATLLVCRHDYVRRDDIKNAMEQLGKANANVIGTVVNCAPAARDSYYYNSRSKDTIPTDAPHIISAEAASIAHGAVPFAVPAPPRPQVPNQVSNQPPRGSIPADSTAQFIMNAGYGSAMHSNGGPERR